MLREALFAKIHRAVVTDCNVEYMGSITIDPVLLDATGMVVNEKVLVADCDNGQRFETYVFLGERGSGEIKVNGAAARRSGVGHRVLIMSFCQLTPEELARHRPRVVICDEHNQIAEYLEYPAAGGALMATLQPDRAKRETAARV
jgi:aspartate 1-decarboxylase